MKFKTQSLSVQLRQLDPRVQALAHYCDAWFRAMGLPEATVTSALRTMDEQIAIYGHMKPSPHLDGRAIDLRSMDYPETALLELDRDVERHFAPMGVVQEIMLIHSVRGGAAHIHLQVCKLRG